MTSEYLSSDFSYKKYSLEQLDNWVNDAVNCEDLTPQDIYDTIIKCVDESVEYHKKYYTKSVELLSLLKGNRPVELEDEKAREREYNRREIEYYNKRAKLDAQHSKYYYDYDRNDPNRENPFLKDLNDQIEEIRKEGGYEWTPGT
jgi:hypothetical protein